MDLRKIAAEAIAEDESYFDGVKRFFKKEDAAPTDLEKHDRRFHPNGFDPKRDHCEYRKQLAGGDKADSIEHEKRSEKPKVDTGYDPTQSEHAYRVGPDGKRVPSNAEFRKALEAYDKDHRIYAVSDTHSTGLDDLDIKDSGIVILGGDFIMRSSEKRAGHEGYASVSVADSKDTTKKWLEEEFIPWIEKHPDKQFVIIPGNHDKYFEYEHDPIKWPENAHFLVDEAVEVNGLKMYGTPWCLYNMNGAYETGHKELAEHFAKIPEGLDVLITHTPPLAEGHDIDLGKEHYGHFGSPELTEAILEKKPKLVICGHVHTGDHTPQKIGESTVINVARVGSTRHSPGYAGRQMAFSKEGDAATDFLVDKSDGQQIDLSAHPEPGCRIKGMLGIHDGKISSPRAFTVLEDAARAVNRGIDAGHCHPAANPIGEYEFAKPYIEKLAEEDKYGDELREAIKAIEDAKKSGWKNQVPRIESPYRKSFYSAGATGWGSYGGGTSGGVSHHGSLFGHTSSPWGNSLRSGNYKVHNPKPMYWEQKSTTVQPEDDMSIDDILASFLDDSETQG